jgi:hypothetical protein
MDGGNVSGVHETVTHIWMFCRGSEEPDVVLTLATIWLLAEQRLADVPFPRVARAEVRTKPGP